MSLGEYVCCRFDANRSWGQRAPGQRRRCPHDNAISLLLITKATSGVHTYDSYVEVGEFTNQPRTDNTHVIPPDEQKPRSTPYPLCETTEPPQLSSLVVLNTHTKRNHTSTQAHRLLSWAICRTCCCPGASEACLAEDLVAPVGATRYGLCCRTLPPCGDTQRSNFSE